MSEQQRLSPGRGSPYCAWCNRSGHNAVPACRDAYEERRASIHPIEKLWREVGLPEYFLGNGGTNDKLYALYDRILCAAQSSQEPVAWRYQRKEGWEDVWRYVTKPPNDFETLGDWTIQALYAVTPCPVAVDRYAVDDPWCRPVGKTWTPDQFWEYVGGLVGEFEAGQMRDMLASKGLSLSSTEGK